jgi:hypothetical protein
MPKNLETWVRLPSGVLARRGRGDVTLPPLTDTFVIGETRPTKLNTGLPSGWVSEGTLNGHQVLTTPTTLYRQTIWGCVEAKVGGCKLIECDVKGPQNWTDNKQALVLSSVPQGQTPFEITRNRLVPTYPTHMMDGIKGHDFIATRNLVLNTVDGFGVFNTAAPGGAVNTQLLGNYFDELGFYTQNALTAFYGTTTRAHPSDTKTHNDGGQSQGGSGLILRGNWLGAFLSQDPNVGRYDVSLPIYANAAFQLNNNVGRTSNMVVDRNWMNGGAFMNNTSGAYVIDNFIGNWTGNRFGRNAAGGPTAPRALVFKTGSTRGTHWNESGNIWYAVGDALDNRPITVYVNA